MQTLKKFYFGRQKLKPNTFIGGIGGTINTPALLAARLGISVNRIKLFKVTGVDVECMVVGTYNLPSNFMGDVSTLTYFKDMDGLVKANSLGGKMFLRCYNLEEVYLPGMTQIYNVPSNWTFENTYGSYIKWKVFYIPNVVIYGPDVGGTGSNNGVFRSNFSNSIKLYAHPSMQTVNNGGVEGDLAVFDSLGNNSIIYVQNYVSPSPIIDLSIDTIYNTAIQLNFTPPTAVNGVDFYEVYVDGKYNNDTRDFLATGLLPSTSYRIKIRAVDMFYNKGDFSNEIIVTTLASNDFISTWKTDNISTGSSSTTQIKLPLVSSGNYNFTVDWGDGTQNTITAWNQVDTVHTYSAIGTYTVRINGVCNGWYFGNSGDRLKLLSIVDWGRLQLSNGNVFHGCSNLSLQNVQGFLDLHYVTSMSSFFGGCSSITTINNLNSWPVGNVQGMNNMFSGATSFNQNIGGWNTSAVIDMSSMFSNASLFNQNISGWNVGSVTNMSNMFASTGFNNGLLQGVDGNMFWNMSELTTANGMFDNAKSFNQNLGALNLSKCLNFGNMFRNASKFNNGGSSDINSWILPTTGNVTFSGMFTGAVEFNQPIDSWNTTQVNNMSLMFLNATKFNQSIGSWNTSNVTTMEEMFGRTVTGTSLFNQDIGAWNVTKVVTFYSMFGNKTGNSGIFISFNNGGSPSINNWTLNTTTGVSLRGMFSYSLFNQPIGSWNTVNVGDISYMFQSAVSFNQDIGAWNTSSVSLMIYTFFGATSFNQNIGNWNVSNVTNFSLFLAGKTPTTFSAANLDAIYNGWSSRPVKTPISITFGTAKYTTASSAGRAILTGAPNNWVITDGGI